MRIALDTNFLVYAEGINDPIRRDIARDLTRRLPRAETCLPTQALGELFHVLRRKARRSADAARAAVLGWRDTFSPIPTSCETLLSAMDLAVDHQFRLWDAIILATAADAGCRLMLSEDLQDGFTWRGISVVNPFAAARHPLLDAALDDAHLEDA